MISRELVGILWWLMPCMLTTVARQSCFLLGGIIPLALGVWVEVLGVVLVESSLDMI